MEFETKEYNNNNNKDSIVGEGVLDACWRALQ